MAVLLELKLDIRNIHVRLDQHDKRFREADVRFERVENILITLQDGQDILVAQVNDLRQRVSHIDYRTEEMIETLNAVATAVDADAITIINHEQRLERIESTIAA